MYKKMSALIGLLTILSTLIATPIAVFADSSSNHKDWGDSFITSGKLTDSSGADQDKFQIHQNMRAQWTYAIPEGTTDLHTGDTMVVSLPSKLKLQTVISFNLDDGHGNTVAKGQADPLTKKITFTFTDYAQEHANAGIDGRFFLDVQWDVQTIKTSTTTVTPVDLDWGTKATATKTTIDAVTGPNANEVLVKVGNFDPQDPSKINWVVRLNYAQKDLQNLKYTDVIGPNQALINNSINIGTVPHKDPSADGNEFGNFEPLTSAQTNITDPQHFSISIPATNKTVLVYYSTKITDDGFAGDYDNSGTLSATDNQTGVVINEVTNATASNKAGGDAATTTSIRGTKIWDDQDNGYGTRPSQVTINLLQDGVKIASKVISAETNWRYNFGKLDIYKPDSTKHVYMVQEDMVPLGYVASGGDANSNYNLTNTLQTMNIPVTKIWDDADNQDGIRPNEVTFALYADGQDTQKQVTLTADNATNNNTWTKNDAFAGLPIETATGAKIVYTVKEVGIAAKYTSNDGTAQNNYTITNSYSPMLMHVTVNKQWNDQDNKDGKRPQQIQVQLYNGNQVIGEPIILSASTGWQGEWNNLPMYDAGQKIIYSAKEVGVTGYDEVDSPIDINNHITITNNLPVNPITPVDPQDPVIDPTKPVDPTEPTDPTTPVDPKEPTDPTKPVEPTEPTDPTKPVEPTEPTDPTKPVEPTEPTDPTTPVDPKEPTDPTTPVDPTEPTDPTKPVEPTEPTKPVEPTEPTDPTTPVEPTEPTKPVEPKEPTEPTKPVDPTEPTDPTTPVDPKEPTDPTKPVDPTEPTEPTKPVEPKEPTDPTTPVEPTEPTKPVDPKEPTEPTKPVEPKEPTDPTKPVEPKEPTDPTKPVEPKEPTDPTTPVEPKEPTDPTKPVDPKEPTEPTKPVDPKEPTDPTKPVEPKEPTDPTTPVDPKEPTDPTKPVDPKEPIDPTKPVDPKEPTDPTTPVDPKEPTDPTKPVEPTGPTDPTTPVEPTGPTDPTKPVEPTGPTDPTTPVEPTGPTDPTKPVEPTTSADPKASVLPTNPINPKSNQDQEVTAKNTDELPKTDQQNALGLVVMGMILMVLTLGLFGKVNKKK